MSYDGGIRTEELYEVRLVSAADIINFIVKIPGASGTSCFAASCRSCRGGDVWLGRRRPWLSTASTPAERAPMRLSPHRRFIVSSFFGTVRMTFPVWRSTNTVFTPSLSMSMAYCTTPFTVSTSVSTTLPSGTAFWAMAMASLSEILACFTASRYAKSFLSADAKPVVPIRVAMAKMAAFHAHIGMVSFEGTSRNVSPLAFATAREALLSMLAWLIASLPLDRPHRMTATVILRERHCWRTAHQPSASYRR